MKTLLLQLSVFAFSLSSGFSSDIFSSSLYSADSGSDDRLIVSSTGIPLNSGYAGTGIFSLTDSEVAQLAASHDLGALFAAFQPVGGTDNFSAGAISELGVDIPGAYITFHWSIEVTPAETGATLYTLVFNTSDAATATEFALFKSDTTLQPDPPAPNPPNNYNIMLRDLVIITGNNGPAIVSPNLGPSAVQTVALVPVPEPSSLVVAIAGFGIAACLRRRERTAG